MTQTMLERAARAALSTVATEQDIADLAIGFEDESGLFASYVDVGPVDFRQVARAVLMAVRVPNEAMSQAVRTTEGWEDMVDFVLNEGEK